MGLQKIAMPGSVVAAIDDRKSQDRKIARSQGRKVADREIARSQGRKVADREIARSQIADRVFFYSITVWCLRDVAICDVAYRP